MVKELQKDLKHLLKVVNNIESVKWKKGQRPVNLSSLVGNILEDNKTAKTSSRKDTKKTDKACSVTAILGPYGTKVEADQETLQFKNPKVFLYRSAIFPNPVTFKVRTEVTESVTVKTKDQSPLYPYGVKLVINVIGEKSNAERWIEAFRNRARPIAVL